MQTSTTAGTQARQPTWKGGAPCATSPTTRVTSAHIRSRLMTPIGDIPYLLEALVKGEEVCAIVTMSTMATVDSRRSATLTIGARSAEGTTQPPGVEKERGSERRWRSRPDTLSIHECLVRLWVMLQALVEDVHKSNIASRLL